ncbi:MAG: N-acetylglucosamine kinase [Thermoguttaceae bacterium]
MQTNDLVLGIDGGATKILAWLAPRDGDPVPAGIGHGGPGNFQAAGVETALVNLDAAVDAAFADAGVTPGTVAAAVLGLAGSSREKNRKILADWAAGRQLADRFRVVSDAMPIIAAGSPDGWGLGLISGTGSFCFGQTADGRSARSGGWGYLFGDEGSAYALAVAGLRAAVKAADGRGPTTLLLDGFLRHLDLAVPDDLVLSVYGQANDRAKIASLAQVVTETAAASDAVARQILEDGAHELAVMVQAVARTLWLHATSFPLALTGGVLCASSTLRLRLESHLWHLGLSAAPIALVEQPVAGAVKLAQADSRQNIPGGTRS